MMRILTEDNILSVAPTRWRGCYKELNEKSRNKHRVDWMSGCMRHLGLRPRIGSAGRWERNDSTCEELVFGPRLAIDRRPGRSWLSRKFSSGTERGNRRGIRYDDVTTLFSLPWIGRMQERRKARSRIRGRGRGAGVIVKERDVLTIESQSVDGLAARAVASLTNVSSLNHELHGGECGVNVSICRGAKMGQGRRRRVRTSLTTRCIEEPR